MSGRHPQADTPLGRHPPPRQTPPQKQPLQWTVGILLECILVFTGRNEVVAKVIFLHLSVIHSVHRGGSASVHVGIPPPPPDQTPRSSPPRSRPLQSRHTPRSRHTPHPPSRPPQADTPPGADSPPEQTSPPPADRILDTRL